MFDIGLGEIVVLAALALLVFGPDQLPKVAAQAGRFVRDLRALAASARKELSDSADLDGVGNDLKSLADLHPKRLAQSLLEDPTPEVRPSAKPASGPTTQATGPTPGATAPQASGYDPDAV